MARGEGQHQGILINGNFLCRPLTGIERFAYEVVSCLDDMAVGDDIALFAPCNSTPPKYKHIRVITSARPLRSFPLWDMVTFSHACARHRREALSFSNTAPLGKRCGMAFIHDVYGLDHGEDFVTLHEKAVFFYTAFHCRNICSNADKIFTVSHFSAERIAHHFGLDASSIAVATNGWEHFARIKADESIFDRLGQVQKGKYYFTLGSLQKRKNLKWVIDCALQHPNDIFVVSGGAVSGYVTGDMASLQHTSNIILTGRIDDGEVKALMTGCKAFLFPSLYEGFGIPPLEALCAGANVVVSDIPVFHEIFGSCVHYVPSDTADIDLDALLAERVDDASETLKKHTYMEAAKVLLDSMRTSGYLS